MKLARFILVTVAVLALVSGALAFKAFRHSAIVYYTNTQTSPLIPSQCTAKVTLSNYQGIDQGLGTLIIFSASLAPITIACDNNLMVFRLD